MKQRKVFIIHKHSVLTKSTSWATVELLLPIIYARPKLILYLYKKVLWHQTHYPELPLMAGLRQQNILPESS